MKMKRKRALWNGEETDNNQSEFLHRTAITLTIALTIFSVFFFSAAAQQDTAAGWFQKGLDLGSNGSFEESAQAFDQAKMGHQDEALKASDRALEISPDYSLALEWKGDALMDQGKYEDALIAYEKAIGADTIFPELWYKKGLALKALGSNSEADVAFAKTKELGYQE